MSKNHTANHCTTDDACEDMVQLTNGIALVSLLITRIHLWVAQKLEIHWLFATLQSTRWMDNDVVCRQSFMAIPVLDSVDVQNV